MIEYFEHILQNFRQGNLQRNCSISNLFILNKPSEQFMLVRYLFIAFITVFCEH